MTFKEYLIYRDIPFKENGELIEVEDKLIIPHEEEFRRLLPEAELWWDYLRYRNEPNRIGD